MLQTKFGNLSFCIGRKYETINRILNFKSQSVSLDFYNTQKLSHNNRLNIGAQSNQNQLGGYSKVRLGSGPRARVRQMSRRTVKVEGIWGCTTISM